MAQKCSVRTITSDTKYLAQDLEEKKKQQFQVVNSSIRLQNAILKEKILMSNHDNRIPKFFLTGLCHDILIETFRF